MRGLGLTILLLIFVVGVSAAGPDADFEGVWLGEITGPNARTAVGLAFTRTGRGLAVSLYFPGMFLYGVDFGPAEIRDGAFVFEPFNLTVARRGDTLTGTFAIAKLPLELRRAASWPPAGLIPPYPAAPAPAWSLPLGAAAWASPVARDGVVYVGTVDGSLHAVRASDGRRLWTWHGPNPLYGEALLTEDSVCLVDDHCDLVCLARANGTLRWRTPLHDQKPAGEPAPRDETFNHRTAAPVIDGRGILYVGSTDHGLYAIRAANGEVVWRRDAGAPICAPVTLSGDDLIVAGIDGSVVRFDCRLQEETMRVKLGGSIVSAPVIAGDRIVVGCRDYLLYGLDAAKGTVAWRDSYWFSWVESTPRLVDGVLYIGGSDYRRVSALDPATGRARWATDVRGLTWGSPVVTATTVYAGTAGQNIAGTLIKHLGGVVALDRRTGAVKWRYDSPVPADATFTGCTGSLVLAAGNIIGAGVDGVLIAFPAD